LVKQINCSYNKTEPWLCFVVSTGVKMSHFDDKKTDLEILLAEKMKTDSFILYDSNLELDDDDFIEVKIEESKEYSNGDKLFTREELPPEFGRWVSGRPKFLLSLLKQRRLKAFKEELCAIRERLRHEFRPK
jgi:hypothetical protein